METHETDPGPGPSKLLYTLAGIVGVCAAAASFTGLIDLALDAGYIPALSPTLPVCVDVYTLAATLVWLSPRTPTKSGRNWARASAIIGLVMSMAGNSLSHAIAAHLLVLSWWQLSAVASVPPLSLALITHLVFVARDTPELPETGPIEAATTAPELPETAPAASEIERVPAPAVLPAPVEAATVAPTAPETAPVVLPAPVEPMSVAPAAPEAGQVLAPAALPAPAVLTEAEQPEAEAEPEGAPELPAEAEPEAVPESPQTEPEAEPQDSTDTGNAPQPQAPTILPPARSSHHTQYARMITARQIAMQHYEDTGRPIGRPNLINGLKKQGYSIGSKTADVLVDQFRAELIRAEQGQTLQTVV